LGAFVKDIVCEFSNLQFVHKCCRLVVEFTAQLFYNVMECVGGEARQIGIYSLSSVYFGVLKKGGMIKNGNYERYDI
jgi:hypothetical protein